MSSGSRSPTAQVPAPRRDQPARRTRSAPPPAPAPWSPSSWRAKAPTWCSSPRSATTTAGDESLRFLTARGVDVRAARRAGAADLRADDPVARPRADDHGDRREPPPAGHRRPRLGRPRGGRRRRTSRAATPPRWSRPARRRCLVVTARRLAVLAASGVRADVLIGSARRSRRAGRRRPAAGATPAVIVQTRGGEGGTWEAADGSRGTWPAVALPGPLRDAYGAGDCFHAALTGALAAGQRHGRGGASPAPARAPRRSPAAAPYGEPMLRRMTDHAERTARYAELVVRVGANVQPGQTVLVNATSSTRRSPVRSPRRRTPAGRATSTSGTGIRTSSARASARAARLAGDVARVARRARPGRGRRRRLHPHRGRSRPDAARRRRSGARDARRDARQPGRSAGPARGHDVLEHLLLPDGRAGPRPSSARPSLDAAVGRRRHGGAARRARPERGLGGAHRRPRAPRRRADRAPVRRDPVPRPGHRPDVGLLPGVALEVGHRDDRATASAASSTCRPRRSSRRPTGGAPRASSAPRGRCCARACWCEGLEMRVQGRPDRAGRRRRRTPSTSAARWRATRAPRSSARWRW